MDPICHLGVRAVLFDVYGTLMVSASGDIGSDSSQLQANAIRETCKQFGLALNPSAEDATQIFERTIRDDHDSSRANGIEHPEVDIVEVWRRVLAETMDGATAAVDAEEFALELIAKEPQR